MVHVSLLTPLAYVGRMTELLIDRYPHLQMLILCKPQEFPTIVSLSLAFLYHHVSRGSSLSSHHTDAEHVLLECRLPWQVALTLPVHI